MIHAMNALVAPAMLQRVTLIVNHVLGAERAATDKLKVHQGRLLQLHLDGWPSMLPAPPVLAFRVTPAGLLEWCGDEASAPALAAPDLQVHMDAANPAMLAARALLGETPALEIHGDAAFAADVNWLAENLRWDVEGDLEKVMNPRAAHEVARIGSAFAKALREAVRRGGDLASKLRPAP